MRRRFEIAFFKNEDANREFAFHLHDIVTCDDGEIVSDETVITIFTVDVNREDGKHMFTFKANANSRCGRTVDEVMLNYKGISPVHCVMKIANIITNMVLGAVDEYISIHRKNLWEPEYTEIGAELPKYYKLDVSDTASMVSYIINDKVVASFVDACISYVLDDWKTDDAD